MAYPFKNNTTKKKINPIQIKKKPTQIKINLPHPNQIKSNHNKQIRDFYQKTKLVDFTMEVTYSKSQLAIPSPFPLTLSICL